MGWTTQATLGCRALLWTKLSTVAWNKKSASYTLARVLNRWRLKGLQPACVDI
jgi:hypothetical protein